MKKNQQRSGVVRCQRCLKYGHYTYQCQNQVAYRYRPSRTVLYKQKIKLQLNTDKGPQTIIKDKDYKRIYVEDKPSSQDQQKQPQKNLQKKQIKINSKQLNTQNINQRNNILNQQQQQKSSSQSQQSSQSSSSQSSSQSSQQRRPRKIKKLD